MVKRALYAAEIGVNDMTDTIASPDPGARTAANDIYQRLRADIVRGVLQPEAPLKSDEIRAAYNIGISPLREALTRLTAERLVTSIGQQGFRVAPLGAANVLDTMKARVLIESEGLRLSIEGGNNDWEARVAGAAHLLRRTALSKDLGPAAEIWAVAHQRYHATLISACNSAWLIQLADILFAQAERHRLSVVHARIAPDMRDMEAEHEEIFEATIARQTKKAIAALTRHYERSGMRVAQLIESLASNAPGTTAAGTSLHRTTTRIGGSQSPPPMREAMLPLK